MSNDQFDEDCAHCLINAAIDEYCEANSPVNVEDLVDDLLACMCELIASNPDAKYRNAYAKKIATLLPKRVRKFRADGRYPGAVDTSSIGLLN